MIFRPQSKLCERRWGYVFTLKKTNAQIGHKRCQIKKRASGRYRTPPLPPPPLFLPQAHRFQAHICRPAAHSYRSARLCMWSGAKTKSSWHPISAAKCYLPDIERSASLRSVRGPARCSDFGDVPSRDALSADLPRAPVCCASLQASFASSWLPCTSFYFSLCL